ncbi:MAG: hypothetical protein K2I19_02980 [Muribaculaceae bacterium]|nr:hypothetical protein [Muribaculaceae bacterium]
MLYTRGFFAAAPDFYAGLSGLFVLFAPAPAKKMGVQVKKYGPTQEKTGCAQENNSAWPRKNARVPTKNTGCCRRKIIESTKKIRPA